MIQNRRPESIKGALIRRCEVVLRYRGEQDYRDGNRYPRSATQESSSRGRRFGRSNFSGKRTGLQIRHGCGFLQAGLRSAAANEPDSCQPIRRWP